MVKTESPLREKMCLLWHRIFATGATKLIQARVVTSQIDMFRQHGMGRFDNLLIELSRDPAMIMWLDNQDNHAASINENYGREILELFSMGVGNYTEDDIKECARAFTGWSVVNPDYMSIKMRNNTARPYGYISWQFEYNDDDHDHGEKTLLGETGDFNGEDAVAIICRQEATARFIARHLYHFFVADELPVPQWPHTPPRDPEAIDVLVQAYFDSGYSVKAMLRALFTSDFFKAEASQFARIKSPAEMVIGTLRLAGGVELPSQDTYAAAAACSNMGQGLLAPPSVEGWQGGSEWINTGAYVQRVNFASKMLNDPSRPGVKAIIERVAQSVRQRGAYPGAAGGRLPGRARSSGGARQHPRRAGRLRRFPGPRRLRRRLRGRVQDRCGAHLYHRRNPGIPDGLAHSNIPSPPRRGKVRMRGDEPPLELPSSSESHEPHQHEYRKPLEPYTACADARAGTSLDADSRRGTTPS